MSIIGAGIGTIISVVSFLVAVILVLFGIVAMLIQDYFWVGLVIFLKKLKSEPNEFKYLEN